MVRHQLPAYNELMRPDEDWRMVPDAVERRKIQNRLAQRAYRESSIPYQGVQDVANYHG
jgi:hypothetical protein